MNHGKSLCGFLLVGLVAACRPTPAPDAESAVGRRPSPVVVAPASSARVRGVNLSGGEFGACCPGRPGIDYGYPTRADVDLFAARGFNHIRLPIRHERLQRALRTDLDAGEWSRIAEVFTYALSKGLSVALEPHNSARYNGVVLTETELGDFWGRVVQRLPLDENTRVWPDLTNEPHDMRTETWLALAQAAVREIRRVGFKGRVLVPGNGWSGAAHWNSSWYGTANAAVMQQVTDPAAVFEAHLYLDADGSGAGTECVSDTIGVERLRPFTDWLHTHARRGYIGEIGAPNTSTCGRAITNLVSAIEREPALIGWAWWSAGSRWPRDYQLSLQPIVTDAGVADRPQLEWLRPFLAACGP